MNERLESVDVTAARPNPKAKWMCGYQYLGMSCAEGPSPNGDCCQLRRGQPVRGEQTDNLQPNSSQPPSSQSTSSQSSGPLANCDPSDCEKNCADAYHCALARLRRHPYLPSHQELGPCIPQRSAWFSRQTLALNAAILVSGILLLCMAIPQREEVFIPGGLSQKHSQILGNHLVSQRCSLCHPNSHTEAKGLDLQDELCMNCHRSHMPDAALRSPHDLTAAQLLSLNSTTGAGTVPRTGASDSIRGEVSVLASRSSKQTSCAVCHVEHHGAGFDLTSIDDARCQACHKSQFASLSDGHPQFNGYPYRTQRRIAFDHRAHQDKYFGAKNQSFDCALCHLDQQESGESVFVFRNVGFERACASCHAAAIQSSTINGWAVLQTPSVDTSDVAEASLGLQGWPAGARFGYEGQISVPLRMLLAADPAAVSALGQLPDSGKLSDIPTEERALVGRSLSRAFRKLIDDVASAGQTAWQQRLATTAQQALGRELNASEQALIGELSSGLPPDLFRHMHANWFGEQDAMAHRMKATPNFKMISQISDEDELLQSGDSDLLLGEAADSLLDSSDSGGDPQQNNVLQLSEQDTELVTLRGSAHVAQGGWYLDEELLALKYMPRGHADRTLAAWAEYIALIESANEGMHEASATQAASWLRPTSGPAMPGSCTECHVLDRADSNFSGDSRWLGDERQHKLRTFTKFNHQPHLTLPPLSDCRYCHVLDVERSRTLPSAQQAADSAPALVRHTQDAAHENSASEFFSMNRAQCVACHRPGGANDDCIQCHNYHIGARGLTRSQTGEK